MIVPRLSQPAQERDRLVVDAGQLAISHEELSADGLRQYRLALARESRRFKRYPEMARESGWQGVVSVLIEVAAVGGGHEVSLAQGSGYEVLDQQALEMVGQAVRVAALPESLKGKGFRLSLPVRYALED